MTKRAGDQALDMRPPSQSRRAEAEVAGLRRQEPGANNRSQARACASIAGNDDVAESPPTEMKSETSPRTMPGMSMDELRALPAAVRFAIVPAAFGISRSAAYRALAAGELPFEPIRIGRKLIVKKVDLLRALGVTEAEGK